MKPKWQRARIIKSPMPELLGALVWLRNERPFRTVAISIRDGKPLKPELRCDTNILVAHRGAVAISYVRLERIAEFADDVPRVSWENFLDQCQKSKQPQS
jgi:hypothetical protein